jgi:hypothetical protein
VLTETEIEEIISGSLRTLDRKEKYEVIISQKITRMTNNKNKSTRSELKGELRDPMNVDPTNVVEEENQIESAAPIIPSEFTPKLKKRYYSRSNFRAYSFLNLT